MKVLIVIPTYNERENIAELLEKIFGTNDELHVLVVDDNSPDRTFDVVEKLAVNQFPGRLFLIKREGKLGLGTAYIAGFKWALSQGYEYIMEMDADFSHNPGYINSFLRAAGAYGLVLGSRYVRGGGVVNWGFIRRCISRGGSLYSRLILWLPVNDATGGFKCFRREVLEAIDLDNVKSNGYSFQIEMTYRAFMKGFRVKEIPIVFEDRNLGKSKMSAKIFLEAVFMVWRLRFGKLN